MKSKKKLDVISKDKKESHVRLRPLALFFLILFIVAVSLGSYIFVQISDSRVYIEKSVIDAPIISLSSPTPGIIDKLFVKEGDSVRDNMVVAIVGHTSIKTKTSGIVTYVENTPGQFVNALTPIVKMIDPNEMRVLGKISEDKGLSDIKVGQKAIFTIDAYPDNKYFGVVDSVSPISRQSDIVFSISDKRQINEFNVKVLFDFSAYPEIKDGMSAKIWVYK